jgi:hypothetical protein
MIGNGSCIVIDGIVQIWAAIGLQSQVHCKRDSGQ